jgi:GT2 family glycosyltransferase
MILDISIIIVSYNTKDLLRNCLESIFHYTLDVSFEIIVIDNASSDGSPKMIRDIYPQINLIESQKNLGFGRANNLGVEKAEGKYLLFLNSDCILLENTLLAFYEFMEKNMTERSIGVIGALLFDKDMNPNLSYNNFPSLKNVLQKLFLELFNKFLGKHVDLKNNHFHDQLIPNNVVDFISGADMFLSKKLFKALDGFDEQFFLYFEETDLQKRISQIGCQQIILTNQKLIHLEGESSSRSKTTLGYLTVYTDSMYKYFKKHYSLIPFIVFYFLITPFFIIPIFKKKYSLDERIKYFKILLRIY